jgi:hypothetical protein
LGAPNDEDIVRKEWDMKPITRREFHRLAAASAIAGARATTPFVRAPAHSPEAPQSQVAAPKPPTKLLLTADQEKKVQEAIAEREKDIAILRSRALPYNLEPAFVFHVRSAARHPPLKG